MKEKGRKVIATNRKARHNYTIIDTYEAGGGSRRTEVKSLREGKASLVDAFATVDDGEVWLRGLHIPEYARAPGPPRAAPYPQAVAAQARDRAPRRQDRGGQPDAGAAVDVLLGRQGQSSSPSRRASRTTTKRQDLARRTAERDGHARARAPRQGMR